MAYAFEWGKLLKCHLKGKTCSKRANGLNIYDLKKTLTTGVILTLPWGYIYAYYHSSQISLLGGPRGRVVKSADISLLHLTIRSSHRCVLCGFEPRSGHM